MFYCYAKMCNWSPLLFLREPFFCRDIGPTNVGYFGFKSIFETANSDFGLYGKVKTEHSVKLNASLRPEFKSEMLISLENGTQSLINTRAHSLSKSFKAQQQHHLANAANDTYCDRYRVPPLRLLKRKTRTTTIGTPSPGRSLADGHPLGLRAFLADHVAAPLELALALRGGRHRQGVVASAAAERLAAVRLVAGAVAVPAGSPRDAEGGVRVTEVRRLFEVNDVCISDDDICRRLQDDLNRIVTVDLKVRQRSADINILISSRSSSSPYDLTDGQVSLHRGTRYKVK